MGAKPLSIAPDDPEESRPSSVSWAASAGSKRDILVAVRDRLASAIDGAVQDRDLASLSLRLMTVVKEIEELDAAMQGDEVGDAAKTPDADWEAI